MTFTIRSAAACIVLAASHAFGAAPPAVRLEFLVSATDIPLSQPVAITHAGDGSNRLFIAEKAGKVRFIRLSRPPAVGLPVVLPPPTFLDMRSRVNPAGEGGLLGLAFHPRYASNGLFYVFYTRLDGSVRVAERRVSAADPDAADPLYERIVMTLPGPASSAPGNYGGGLAFGPDGELYVGTGDVDGAAAATGSPLGKLFRVEDLLSGWPFPRVIAMGLRNPRSLGFDRLHGDLFVADRGASLEEEVNVVWRENIPPSTPIDFEWPRFEGRTCVTGVCPLGGNATISYRHSDPAGGSAVTGGSVYRGMRSPGLAGWYVYGDFATNRIWAARREVAAGGSQYGPYTTVPLLEPNGLIDGLSAFGEDEQGEIYVASQRSGTLYRLQTVVAAENVALGWGTVASASSQYSDAFGAFSAIDGERAGRHFGRGSGWNDADTRFPDWLQVQFAGMRTIDRVVVYSMQDSYLDPVEPTDATAFTAYGLRDFTVEGWTGSAWVTLARVTNNSMVRRVLEFPPIAVDRIFINVTRAEGGYSHITEVEAWTPASRTEMNYAAAGAGAVAWASSTYSPAFPASAVIDADRAGRNWGSGSGWNDGTYNAGPDWLQVYLGGMRTIDRVVVYALQDDALHPVEPNERTFAVVNGIRDFTVEGWTGTSWVVLGRVTGNSLAKRAIAFPPVAVDRIFVNLTSAMGGYAHVVEVEAWGPAAAPVVLPAQ